MDHSGDGSMAMGNMDNSDAASAAGGGDQSPFCMTPGTPMYAGLTYMAKGGEACFTFLFDGAVTDTPAKYGFAIVGAFLLGLTTEGLRCARNITRRRRPSPTKHSWSELVVYTTNESILFAIHMTVAYAVMLLVMSFEWLIITGIVLGLTAGFFGGELVLLAYLHAGTPKGKEGKQGLGMGNAPCCDMGEDGEEVMEAAAPAGERRGEEEVEFVHG